MRVVQTKRTALFFLKYLHKRITAILRYIQLDYCPDRAKLVYFLFRYLTLKPSENDRKGEERQKQFTTEITSP